MLGGIIVIGLGVTAGHTELNVRLVLKLKTNTTIAQHKRIPHTKTLRLKGRQQNKQLARTGQLLLKQKERF